MTLTISNDILEYYSILKISPSIVKRGCEFQRTSYQ